MAYFEKALVLEGKDYMMRLDIENKSLDWLYKSFSICVECKHDNF